MYLTAILIISFIFQTLNAQCLNRPTAFLPNCGPNILPLPIAETIIPNQVVLGPNYPQVIDGYAGLNPTTIIQDSTVANNLANALQLLVVSNLLSNTLNTPELLVPGVGYGPVEYKMAPVGPIVAPMGPCGYGPYSYVY